MLGAELAAQLRELCRGVVDRRHRRPSTRIDGVATAGKTGTAQKAIGGRYVQRFVASFGGFVPADDPAPRLPGGARRAARDYHWGGQSAAPTFQRIVEGILRDGR